MDIFSVLTLIGGLALFLYGMNTMGDGLSKASGGKLEKILEKLTSNPIKAVLLGAGVTAVIQSSSATTVMVVGFVNSGIMKLSQAVGIIMGANVGTTATSWILSLSGIESENFLIKLLKPSSFSPVLAIIGVAFILFTKKDKLKDIGKIMIGFAILMTGMSTMSGAVEPLADVPAFTNILTMFSNPILGLFAGLLLTAVIQSSSASVGILQALCTTGSLTYATAFPIIMGQNIGTCVTAMLSGIGANKNAKRAALVHLYFNIIGTAVFMIVFYTLHIFLPFSFMTDGATPVGIAVIHSVFNIVATILLLPFGKVLVKLSCLTVRDEENNVDDIENNEFALLDNRFLDKPSLALEHCMQVTHNMADISAEALTKSLDLLTSYTKAQADEVVALETRVDHYEDELGTYLMKLSSKHLSDKDSELLSMILHAIGDFERISDHAVNLSEAAEEMHNKKMEFSDDAKMELNVFTAAIREIIHSSFTSFFTGNVSLAETVEPLEEVIDGINEELKQRHIKRLMNGHCTIELGFVLSDITTNYERVADHCSNIAVCLIEVKKDDFETHEYLDTLKRDNNEDFKLKYKQYKDKYRLP